MSVRRVFKRKQTPCCYNGEHALPSTKGSIVLRTTFSGSYRNFSSLDILVCLPCIKCLFMTFLDLVGFNINRNCYGSMLERVNYFQFK